MWVLKPQCSNNETTQEIYMKQALYRFHFNNHQQDPKRKWLIWTNQKENQPKCEKSRLYMFYTNLSNIKITWSIQETKKESIWQKYHKPKCLMKTKPVYDIYSIYKHTSELEWILKLAKTSKTKEWVPRPTSPWTGVRLPQQISESTTTTTTRDRTDTTDTTYSETNRDIRHAPLRSSTTWWGVVQWVTTDSMTDLTSDNNQEIQNTLELSSLSDNQKLLE